MQTLKYSVNQHQISTFLAFVKDGQIAIPEVQRPFVQEINIAIGSKSPDVYFKELQQQCEGGKKKYGAIETMEELLKNLETHCIPLSIFEKSVEGYDNFLNARRKLMSEKIRKYYNSL